MVSGCLYLCICCYGDIEAMYQDFCRLYSVLSPWQVLSAILWCVCHNSKGSYISQRLFLMDPWCSVWCMTERSISLTFRTDIMLVLSELVRTIKGFFLIFGISKTNWDSQHAFLCYGVRVPGILWLGDEKPCFDGFCNPCLPSHQRVQG